MGLTTSEKAGKAYNMYESQKKDLKEHKQRLDELRKSMKRLKVFAGLLGWSLICGVVCFEPIAEKLELQYQSGFGLFQILIAIIGITFAVYGVSGRPKK